MSSTDILDEFDDIRPYRDDELPDKIASLARNRELIGMACRVRAPLLYRLMPLIARWIVGTAIRRRTRNIVTVSDLQTMLVYYVKRMAESTTDGFSHSGIDALPRDEPCIFISNHRDIVLDSTFVNYALWLNGFPMTQNAVGDNLLQGGLGNELMRMNRSFTVVRQAKSARAQYLSLLKASKYIRSSLESGESIWIAQRSGRSKDGLDYTDPAILKMFLLAYRNETRDIRDWLNHTNLVPVSVSYQIDPCAPLKARELQVLETQGEYKKDFGEDLRSIAQGIKGFKGQVHVSFSKPIDADCSTPADLAEHIDSKIWESKARFDTYAEAARMLEESSTDCKLKPGRVRQEFESQISSTPASELRHLLIQYANQLIRI